MSVNQTWALISFDLFVPALCRSVSMRATRSIAMPRGANNEQLFFRHGLRNQAGSVVDPVAKSQLQIQANPGVALPIALQNFGHSCVCDSSDESQ